MIWYTVSCKEVSPLCVWGSVSLAPTKTETGTSFCPATRETLNFQNRVKYFCWIIIIPSWFNCQVLLYIIFMPQPPKKAPKPLPETEMPVGRKIARFRKLRGFSQEALAEVIGISQKQVSDYETGRVHLNDEMIMRFALTLKVTADELLGLKALHQTENPPTLRFTRRIRELTRLPESKKRAILKILDDLIRANS